jgi:hypothetical protein
MSSIKPKKMKRIISVGNPFEKKEIWDMVKESIVDGKSIDLPGIGLKKTPIYLLK